MSSRLPYALANLAALIGVISGTGSWIFILHPMSGQPPRVVVGYHLGIGAIKVLASVYVLTGASANRYTLFLWVMGLAAVRELWAFSWAPFSYLLLSLAAFGLGIASRLARRPA